MIATPEIIRSTILSRCSELRFGMSTRNGGVSREPFGMNTSFSVGDDHESIVVNRQRIFDQLNIAPEEVAIPRQEHTSTIRRVDFPGSYKSCDALITDRRRLFLHISFADCLPIFLFDPEKRCVGAIHAGWRGSKGLILDKTLDALKSEFGSIPASIVAFIGPGAGVCCYEVGEEVASEFPEQFVVRNATAKPRLDLKMFNRDILLRAGVKERNIEVSPFCTICSPKVFHSYRRDGDQSGRMMALIGLKE